MVVVMMTVPENPVAKMTMTMAVAMSAMAAARVGLTGTGQGSRSQDKSGNRRRDDRLEFRHERLLG